VFASSSYSRSGVRPGLVNRKTAKKVAASVDARARRIATQTRLEQTPRPPEPHLGGENVS
jgi:hypothetical protein